MGDGWLNWGMGGYFGVWVVKPGVGWLSRGMGAWLSWEMGGQVGRWLSKLGDGWLSCGMGG